MATGIAVSRKRKSTSDPVPGLFDRVVAKVELPTIEPVQEQPTMADVPEEKLLVAPEQMHEETIWTPRMTDKCQRWDPVMLGQSIKGVREALGLSLDFVGEKLLTLRNPARIQKYENAEFWSNWAQRMEGDGILYTRPTLGELDFLASALLNDNNYSVMNEWRRLAGYG